MVCTNRSCDVHIPGAAYGSDFSPERFGNLDRECTHTTRGAINQNLVAWLDPSLITKTLKGGEGSDGYGCRVLKRIVGPLQRHFIFKSAHILGKPSPCESCYAEHFVAWLKLFYVFANRLNPPCDITADDLAFCGAQPGD